ncbi:MAG: pseudomurein-binding repeat-containing protein [Methanosphaera sp.]|uniref:pseudomurein-binding repeat-containing protein n=1 Tax=Methanosphaera sp. TaxID=2666342 RepID=UPI0025FCE3FA|nr:pseudomurein-binding repeat-containing protein [Methanosphaera sp.]MCI5867716.1 adhesin [Methanosphaera sp.]MDD6535324.1 pseudomurein-binding repeat-containing protein [Methanosphaera sp.]MDY3956486.1 pseudomurein-binding repeat-containing protein [Methanosphaera sp.]
MSKFKSKMELFIVLILVFASVLQCVSATSVFLTSDNIGGSDNDFEMLNEIKDYIMEFSNGKLDVIVDPESSTPGEGTRAIESNCDVSVNFAAVDCGNLKLLAKYSAGSDKQVIFVNTGNLDLESRDFIKRAWDDNYSETSFAAIASPSKFLDDAGISYIQPLKKFPNAASDGVYTRSQSDVNKYIAQEVVNSINSYDASESKSYDESLILKHNLQPQVMAEASSAYLESNTTDSSMNDTYNSYSQAQLLYLTSSYLNGSALVDPKDYDAPSNPLKYSFLTKDSYSYYDYVNMAKTTQQYMNENGRAPDYITYEGAYIGYYDLLYNFAKITQNHTTNSQMGFDRYYSFDKSNDSILINMLPVAIVGIIVLVVLYAIRSIFRRRSQRNRRRRY